MELPIFSGEDAPGWLVRVERYFDVNGVHENERPELILVALEGRALSWYQGWEDQHPYSSWRQFREALLRRFQPEMVKDPYGPLLRLQQSGPVMDYIDAFERISGPMKEIDREILRGIFINGLKGPLRAEVKSLGLETLEEIKDRALILEERNREWKEEGVSFGEKKGVFNRGPNSSHVGFGGKVGGGHNGQKPIIGGGANKAMGEERRLSQVELQDRSRKGLCFKCGDKWGPEHKCKFQNYQLLLVREDGDMSEEESEEFSEKEELQLDAKCLQLSLSSLKGLTSNKSLKVWGEIQGRPVIVMVDSGASCNFLSKTVALELKLKIEETPEYSVEVGNGQVEKSKGVCKDVSIWVQGIEIQQPFFLMELGGTDVILGVDWLASLGDIKANFQKMTISWRTKETLQGIHGDPSLCRAKSSWKATLKALRDDGEGYFIAPISQGQERAVPPTPTAGIQRLLAEFEDVFKIPAGLPPEREQDHAIVLKDGAEIPNVRPYRYPYYQKNEIERIISEMLIAGIVRPSISPYSSPVILVKKKDGGWRFCVDYRALNKVTVPNKFPIPVIDELLDELGEAKVFTKLDLKSGYHQIRMRAEDVEKTAFRTHEGHYEFLVMPFGLTNAPSTFQALMNKVLKPYLRKFVLVFFDDILIYSLGREEHYEHLRKVLELLRLNQLYVNEKKCSFEQEELEYLGHLISGSGVAADPRKVQDMLNWPIPTDLKGLRGFLGLTGYYRRFVQGYGKKAWPLTQLLKKDNFSWGMEAQLAFEELKRAMTELPVLAVPCFHKEFVIETDASSKGLGAVLMQEGRPIAYMSQTLSDRAQKKSVYERELMAIVLAIQKWRHYLLGRHFVVHTDQKSLKFLIDQRMMGEEQQRWVAKLLGYDFEIKYKPGRENRVADALSRKFQFAAISTVQFQDWVGLEEEVMADDKLKAIIQDLLQNGNSQPGYQFKKGRLYYKTRLVLPSNSPRIPLILQEFHDSVVGGHSGFFRTYKRISNLLYWEGMRKQILQYIQSCEVCQRNKYQTLSPAGLLQPLPIPTDTWTDISMDFIGGLPKVGGVDTILVVVDRLSKYAHFLALSHPYTAKDVAAIFVKEVVRLHGFPRSIVTDRDRLFMSSFWTELFKTAGTKLRYSSAYHPQTDGQTEVVNRCLETYLRCFSSTKPRQWPKWLSWAEYWFNTNYNSSIKTTPFKALYGRDPPTLLRGNDTPSAVDEVTNLVKERNLMLDELKFHLETAQCKMKQYADKKRRDVEYEVGEMVYLKIQPYRLKSLATRLNQKLSPRYYGPYKVLEKIGQAAYRLELPEGSKVHPVFHVCLLKKCIAATVQSQPLPPGLNEEWELNVEPAEVLAVRRNQQGELEVLVKWLNLPDFESSWELAAAIQEHFPSFHLEDKVRLQGGSIDSINEAVSRGSKQTDCTRVYSRRKYKQGNVHQGGELPHNDESGPLTA